jgi:hypothetical protein
LVSLHQLQGLALDIILSPNDVREDWWQNTTLELDDRYFDVELTRALILEIKLNVVLLYQASVL